MIFQEDTNYKTVAQTTCIVYMYCIHFSNDFLSEAVSDAGDHDNNLNDDDNMTIYVMA